MKDITKILAVSVLSIILLITPVASQPPQLPMVLYGTVNLNGLPAPVGTTIAAYDGDTHIGTVTIVDEGEYGVDSPLTRMAVNEPSTGEIKIYIQTPSMSNSVEANEVLGFWNTGDVVRFDVSAEYTGSSSGPNLNTGGSGSSSSSSGLSYDTEENNDVEALPGGSGLVAGLSQDDNQISPEPTSSPGSGGINSTLLMISIIGIIALIGLFYARQKNMF